LAIVRLNKKDKEVLSDSPIRKCSSDCYLFKNGGQGCRFYIENKVKFGEVCLLDLHKLREYATAFMEGDSDVVKNDASKITATIMMQLDRMLEQVNVDGVTVEEPILDAKGNPIYIPDPAWKESSGKKREMVPAMRIKDHPLIARVIQITKAIGIDLANFKLTPRSAEEKLQVSGRLVVEEQHDLKKVLEDRKLIEQKMLTAIELGNQMTRQDPVWKQLTENDEAIA